MNILTDKSNILINFLLMIASYIFHTFGQVNVIEMANKNNIKNIPLFDMGFKKINTENKTLLNLFCTKNVGLSDSIIVLISLLSTIYFFINNIEILSKSFLVVAICFFLRTILFNLTILPIPKNCSLQLFVGGCHDLLFSGHYIFLTICLFTILNFTNINFYIKLFLLLVSFISIYGTIICKNHYSIDIVLSFVITYLVCYIVFYPYPKSKKKMLENNENIGKQ